jgi:hypothetical protein
MRNYKSTLSCKICNESATCCLDFHHRDPSQKEFVLSDMANRGQSIKVIEKEIAKCIVLCSNCHRKLHAGLIDLP